MSRRPELSMDEDLMVRKGEARAVGPAAVAPAPQPESPPAPPPAIRELEPPLQPARITDEPPIVIGTRKTVERVFTNVRIPKDLDDRLFRMIVETRNTKQQIIEDFIRAGLDRYEKERRRAG